jgi:uncharacterized protein with GYD domain
MSRYLIRARYTAEGARGIASGGGSARRTAVEKMVSAAGGSLESFYFAFGDEDVYTIVELPDHTAAAAVALAVNASGAVNLRTVVLLSPEEIDAAARKTVGYTPPGG